MDDSLEFPDPPDDLPADVVTTLQQLPVHELREAIIYAQELLQNHHEPTTQIEPLPGEEIVELTEEDGYTKVVKRQPCTEGCDECPHGPFVYHVKRESLEDGSENLHWVFMGPKTRDV